MISGKVKFFDSIKTLSASPLMMIGLIIFITPASADVKVTITRDLPNERQYIVQQFPDMDGFEMWMQQRLEDTGCDPYVTDMKVEFDYVDTKS